VIVGIVALVLLLTSILSNGASSFRQTFIEFPVTLEAERLDPAGNRDPAEMARVTTFGYLPIIAQAFSEHIDSLGIEHDRRLARACGHDLGGSAGTAQGARSGEPRTSSGRL
jgi:phosphate transport system permease protein